MSWEPHAVLKGAQAEATRPDRMVWLSASAGTGKTYVLSARVLRLLLRPDVKPDAVLCLTFTKAGAAEMARRVHERLAAWAMLDDGHLQNELDALGEKVTPQLEARARQLFARVLETPAGGLRVMTIHAFCQTLLAAFPAEAGLPASFRPIEEREERGLVAETLAQLVVEGEREGDPVIGQLQRLSLRFGEAGAEAFLLAAAKKSPALEGLGAGLRAVVRREFGVPSEFDVRQLHDACADDVLPEGFASFVEHMRRWNTTTGLQRLDKLADWRALPPAERVATLATLKGCWCNQKGEFFKGKFAEQPGYQDVVGALHEWCEGLREQAERAALADSIADALEAGRTFGRRYDKAKRRQGVVDFDDLIRETGRLLAREGIGEWIRYKLDQATDHVLIDEAQDTNFDQWAIVANIVSEYFAGAGAKGEAGEPPGHRTLFTVGDFKQAIFSFQGTDPQHYRAMREVFAERARDAELGFARLSLNDSFRSAPAVLEAVDATCEALGQQALGLGDDAYERHGWAKTHPGSVTLLPPVKIEDDADDEEDDAPEERWAEVDAKLADEIAGRIKSWLAKGLRRTGTDAPVRPGDIMILLRKRGELARLLVAKLYKHGVPVAGLDRLRLPAPIVVKDLLAAMRFAAQPRDDLNLASLLVSPLFGWNQERLFNVAHGRPGTLWEAVRPHDDGRLGALLNAADRVSPYQFLEEVLSGPLQGRAKLLARLGEEARDPVDELLNAALQFEREGLATLEPFLAWFDRSDGELKREAEGAGNAVRVMTAHGAKGLQAPIVILADACGDPDKNRRSGLKVLLGDPPQEVPLPPLKAEERALVPKLKEAHEEQARRERQEHWRLLYVAMTRAEERLIVAGTVRPGKEPPPESWWEAVRRALAELRCEGDADGALHHGEPLAFKRSPLVVVEPREAAEPPAWLRAPAPQEARPPRPFAPSSLGEDKVAAPPAVLVAAARRGTLLHGLFQRLPEVPPEARRAAGWRYLVAQGMAEEECDELLDAALAVVDAPEFAELFAPGGLAEVPVAGVVGGAVIAGTVDRLVVRDDAVELVDFKTGARVPGSADTVPEYHLRQMAAYAAVLRGAFPGRPVRASLLYSAGPALHRLSDAQLAAFSPA